MRVVKRDQPASQRKVLTVDFAKSGQPLFYARMFYELPVPCLVVQLSSDPRIVDANKLALDALPHSPFEVIGAKFDEVFDSLHSLAPWLAATEKGAPVWNPTDDPEVTFASLTTGKRFRLFGATNFDSGGQVHLVILFGVCEAGYDSKGQHAGFAPALIDPVTGFPNTLAAERKLDSLCSTLTRSTRDFVVAILSLEGWRKEREGGVSKFADELMVTMSSRLTPWIEDGIFISRYRSDEFLVTFYNRPDCKKVIEEVFDTLTREYVIHGFSFDLSVSAGIYIRNVWDPLLPEEILRKARKSVLRAKLEGGNRCVVYCDQMERPNRHGPQVESIIDAFRRGEFCLYYQPVVDLETGCVEFAEGLLRWECPNSGIKKPIDFLQSIEDLDVYVDVNLWVLDLALSMLETWQKQNIASKLCINIDARHLASEVFIQRAISLIGNYDFTVSRGLSIDITNLAEISDTTSISNSIEMLVQHGLTFAVDDFSEGDTGLFALPSLLAVSKIKVNQSYISNIEDDLGSLFLLHNISEFARNNGLSVYAKGVETEKQFNLLRALGFSGAQGYAISEPMAEDAYIDFLSRFESDQPVSRGPGSLTNNQDQVFSFVFTEHRVFLEEMLRQAIIGANNRDDGRKNFELKVLLELLSATQNAIAESDDEKHKIEFVHKSVRRLVNDISEAGSRSYCADASVIKEKIFLLSELIIALKEMSVGTS